MIIIKIITIELILLLIIKMKKGRSFGFLKSLLLIITYCYLFIVFVSVTLIFQIVKKVTNKSQFFFGICGLVMRWFYLGVYIIATNIY